MAAELVGGMLLEGAVSQLSELVVDAIKKTYYFKSELKKMQETVQDISPICNDMEKLSKSMDQWEGERRKLMNLVKQAEDLVLKCGKIKWLQRHSHASKLNDMNESLQKFVGFNLQLLMARDVLEATALIKKIEKLISSAIGSDEPLRDLNVTVTEPLPAMINLQRGSSSGVPLHTCNAIGFNDRLRYLKAMVLKDSMDGDCSVVVVSAAAGYGKTTLAQMLCTDPDIEGNFDRNIYFASISMDYDIKAIIKRLIGWKQECDFYDDDDAILQWRRFLVQNKSAILLVLDDVWSDSIIMKLKYKLPRYKILVTSRKVFAQFNTYQLPALNDKDAASLFRRSSFSNHSNNTNIPEDLVDKLVKCCRGHPLALKVLGASLMGKPEPNWRYMLKRLSKEKKSFLDLHKSIEHSLEKSLHTDEPKVKKCYLDLGLFPEDQKIAATALMDMWAHLYNHDDHGLFTMEILHQLSSRNLATLLPKRGHLSAIIANNCEEEYVTQHDLLREMAIHLASQEPIEHRERLIISSGGQDHPQLSQTVNARILSITTDERFSLTWNKIQAPKVIVFVMNFMSNMHPLPQFIQNMERLKVLIITNYGNYFSEIENFPASQYISGLTRIRLDHVSISAISTTMLMLENLQKLSLIRCKIGNSFSQGTPNKWTSLLEIYIDSCDELVTFPALLCNLVRLKNLSITNCHELTSLSEEFGKLSNLEVLRLASCSEFSTLPESVRNLKKLRFIDLSQCLRIHELPLHIGELGNLQTIDVRGCMGLWELPKSVSEFYKLKVVCDKETSYLWSDFENLEIEVVEEDTLA